MIKLQNIEKFYTNKFIKTYVLRNINLEVKEGEFISVMGPSGSGKSTLLHILGMLDSPSEGEYYFFDEPVHKMKEKKLSELHKTYIGFVFQQYHLIDELTVYENLETPLLYQKVKGNERKGRVAEVLDRFNIVAKKDLFPNQLSGGHQQVVAIARAIIGHPKLILADEPTGSLHSEHGKIIMDTLKQLNEQGTTIIQVTHNPLNAAYARRIIKLSDGWIEGEDSKRKDQNTENKG
jgi:ABC-type lipoprotein export system ATPase subunit